MSLHQQKSLLSLDTALFRPTIPDEKQREVYYSNCHGSAKGLLLANVVAKHKRPILVICRNSAQAARYVDEINFFLDIDNGIPTLLFPDWENLPYDHFSPHPDILSQRISVLAQLPHFGQGAIITTVAALTQRLAPKQHIAAQSLKLRIGDTLDLNKFRDQLTRTGYYSVPQVTQPGEYAVRGGLIDLHVMGQEIPCRIDLFGETIETIRLFDPSDQRTIKNIESINFLPAREFPTNEEGIQCFRQNFRNSFSGDPQKNILYRSISDQRIPAGIEYYLPLFFKNTETLLDYLPEETFIVAEESIPDQVENFYAEVKHRYEQLSHDVERPI